MLHDLFLLRGERTIPIRALCRAFPLVLAALLTFMTGCSKETATGVTFTVATITKGADGKVSLQEPVKKLERAMVEDGEELDNAGSKFAIIVRKTQYERATFDISFPDGSNQRVQVKAGEIKDVLPRGQKAGVRLAVLGSR
jgi:hypothetical protein